MPVSSSALPASPPQKALLGVSAWRTGCENRRGARGRRLFMTHWKIKPACGERNRYREGRHQAVLWWQVPEQN